MNNEITYLLKIIEKLHKQNRYLTNKVADLEEQLKNVNTIRQLDTAQKLQSINKNLKDILGDDYVKVASQLSD